MSPDSESNCDATLVVYEPVRFGDFVIECLQQCVIILKSKNVDFKSFRIESSARVELNAVYLKADSIDLQAREGRLELNYAKIL